MDAATAETPASRRITVTFGGADGPASEPCGEDYFPEAVESENGVVVIVRTRAHGGGESCLDYAVPRTVVVGLARPLGERTIFDVLAEEPVPLTITGAG